MAIYCAKYDQSDKRQFSYRWIDFFNLIGYIHEGSKWLREVYAIALEIASTIDKASDPELNEYTTHIFASSLRKEDKDASWIYLKYFMMIILKRKAEVSRTHILEAINGLQDESNRLLQIREEIFANPMTYEEQAAVSEAMSQLYSAAIQCFFEFHIGPLCFYEFFIQKNKLRTEPATDPDSAVFVNHMLEMLCPQILLELFGMEWESLTHTRPSLPLPMASDEPGLAPKSTAPIESGFPRIKRAHSISSLFF